MTNLVEVVEHLTPNQRTFLIQVIQRWMEGRENLHAGLLPFIGSDEAILALAMHDTFLGAAPHTVDTASTVNLIQRFIRRLQSVIRQFTPHPGVNLLQEAVTMQLSDTKILKRFRRHNQRLSFRLPTKPDAMVGLRHLGPNKWEVIVNKKHVEAATIWLAENLR